MCVVIDSCSISRVFDQSNKEHHDFVPILKWISAPSKGNKGRMVYGGSTYQQELEGAGHEYVRMVNELSRAGRVVKLDDAEVDRIERALKKQVNDQRCDDQHLIAIVIVSRCAIVCTNDTRAFPYLKRNDLYRPHGLTRPRIYRRKTNRDLCSPSNIIGRCRD